MGRKRASGERELHVQRQGAVRARCVHGNRSSMLLDSESRQGQEHRGSFGPDDVNNREQWKAFQEASDMSEFYLRGALRVNLTKGLEEGRLVLDQSLDFMAYLLPLHILSTLVSWSHWGVSFGCPSRYPK